MTAPDDLLGGWLLDEWDLSVDGQHAGWPMGSDADGQLIYAPDGTMSAVLMRRDRPTFGVSQFPRGTPDQRLAAADGYLSYGGSYELADEVVVHHVSVSLFPDFVGTDLVRDVSWDGPQLILTSVPETTSAGRTVVNRLRWRRPNAKTADRGRLKPPLACDRNLLTNKPNGVV